MRCMVYIYMYVHIKFNIAFHDETEQNLAMAYLLKVLLSYRCSRLTLFYWWSLFIYTMNLGSFSGF